MSKRTQPIGGQGDEPVSPFVAEVVHELRTPLAAILGYAELLAAADLPVDQRAEHTETIRRNAESLHRLVNDLLDASRADGVIDIQPVACRPCDVAEDVCRLLSGAASGKGLELRCERTGDASIPAVMTDPARLRQILINLVGNAIRFTDGGHVTVRLSAECATDADRPVNLRFEVQDAGIGLSPEQLHRLTGSDATAAPTTSTRAGGSGLGLFICRKLANALGARIDIQSQPGRGSMFTLVLPCNYAPADVLAPEHSSHSPGVATLANTRVLLVEDDPDIARLIALHLHRAGAKVHTARTGRAAVEMALASRSQGLDYDLILMDQQVPIISGCEAIATLRQLGWRAPIILLSADTSPDARKLCAAAGGAHCLPKSTPVSNLIASCATWARTERSVGLAAA